MNDDRTNNNDDYTRSDEYWDGFDEGKAQAEWEKAAADANKKWNFSSNGNDKDKKDKKQSYFVQKYSEDKLLAEAVIVGAIPYFAVARQNGKELTLSLESSIPIDDKNEYKPYERAMYLNKPYTFRSKQDFEAYIEKARTETCDSMYRKVKLIWLKYIDTDDYHISICAKAKGFNQRVIELQCYAGEPDLDIAEVVNSAAGEEEFQHLLDELNETRNMLLAVRLLHFNQKIPDIELNLKGREKQLFKSIVRIFQGTKTLDELLPVISRYVAQKREANFSTLHAFLYRAVKDIIKAQKKTELSARLVHDYIKTGLQGEYIPGKSLSYETPEFGTLSEKGITETLEHIFGVKTRKVGGIRMLAFDLAKLDRLSRIYDLAIEVQVLQEDKEESSSEKSGSDIGTCRQAATSTDDSAKSMGSINSERENLSETTIPCSQDPSNASNPTHKNDDNNVLCDSIKPYEHLIKMKELPSTGATVYKCKEHPDSPEYYDLKGIQESHFKPYHKKVE